MPSDLLQVRLCKLNVPAERLRQSPGYGQKAPAVLWKRLLILLDHSPSSTLACCAYVREHGPVLGRACFQGLSGQVCLAGIGGAVLLERVSNWP